MHQMRSRFRFPALVGAFIGAAWCPHVAVAAPDHVVIAIMENRSYDSIIGSADAPYINSLVADAALMTASYGVTHPSQPNYFWLFSGSNQGVTDNTCPVGPFATDNLGSLLVAVGYTFTGYSDELPAAGSTVCSSGAYRRKHNPWVSFSNIAPAQNQPFTAFPADFTTLPTVSIVVPNQLHDMHDGTIAEGDAWLAANLDAYVQWAGDHNSLFVLTWDEDDNLSGNHIATLILGAGVVPGAYAQVIDHVDLLRTIEDLYGLGYAGTSASATPIANIFASCGNGIVESPEECDGSDAGCGAGESCSACQCVTIAACSSGIVLSDVSLSLAADPFTVRLRASAILPAPFAGVNPPVAGVRVRVDSASGTDGFDATLPGGAAWTTNSAGTRWTYVDPTASVAGITKAVVIDRSAKQSGEIRILVKGRGGAIVLPAPTGIRTAVVFGDPDECASAEAADTLSCSGDSERVRCR